MEVTAHRVWGVARRVMIGVVVGLFLLLCVASVLWIVFDMAYLLINGEMYG